MYIDPRHLNAAQEPTHAIRHRAEYLSEKRAQTKANKKTRLPAAPTVDVQLLRAQIASRMGRFFGTV